MAKAIIYADSASALDPNLSATRFLHVPTGARVNPSDRLGAAG